MEKAKKGIIYLMETVVPGLIKIGKTHSDNFEQRMYNLERNGYNNVSGLKRRFAIEVEEYDAKEILLHNLFDKNRLQNSELFAIDIDLMIQLLSSFEGKQIYPKDETKEEVFADATKQALANADENIQASVARALIPEDTYYLKQNKKDVGLITAKMRVENGHFIVLKGSKCAPVSTDSKVPEARREAVISNGVLMEDVECTSPSIAGWIPLGMSNNGWLVWKTSSGEPIDIFRQSSTQ
ncbi:MAG: hypothetical protein K2N27_05230 [Ruminococcus sp.]|nr:hypothetical protein [Ruminococcus sp.]